MNQILALFKKCKKSESSFIIVLIRYLLIKIYHNKSILLHQKVRIKGLKSIETQNLLEIGIAYVGFIHKSDKTFLNINGKLKLSSCLLYTSPSPRDATLSRMPSSA